MSGRCSATRPPGALAGDLADLRADRSGRRHLQLRPSDRRGRRPRDVDGPAARATTVAVDDDGTIVGTANMFANRPGPGDHVASGNYMVAAGHRGAGIGQALIEDSLSWARAAGFRAMQFNAVAESNTPAIRLYERVGFATVGRVPGRLPPPRARRGRPDRHAPPALTSATGRRNDDGLPGTGRPPARPATPRPEATLERR